MNNDEDERFDSIEDTDDDIIDPTVANDRDDSYRSGGDPTDNQETESVEDER